jgi:hypothetical protein
VLYCRTPDVANTAPDLDALIRAKLASGELPSAKPEKVWAGKGTGQPCGACGVHITAADLEYELDFPGAPTAGRLHHACLIIWDRLRDDIPPPKADAA